jgi:hypothetical protein
MPPTPAQRAVSAALLSLVAFGGCFYFLLSGTLGTTWQSVPAPAVLGIGMCVALFLHWFFVGLAAQRLGRSVWGWVTLSVLLFPIASITALILYHWLERERGSPPAAAADN